MNDFFSAENCPPHLPNRNSGVLAQPKVPTGRVQRDRFTSKLSARTSNLDLHSAPLCCWQKALRLLVLL